MRKLKSFLFILNEILFLFLISSCSQNAVIEDKRKEFDIPTQFSHLKVDTSMIPETYAVIFNGAIKTIFGNQFKTIELNYTKKNLDPTDVLIKPITLDLNSVGIHPGVTPPVLKSTIAILTSQGAETHTISIIYDKKLHKGTEDIAVWGGVAVSITGVGALLLGPSIESIDNAKVARVIAHIVAGLYEPLLQSYLVKETTHNSRHLGTEPSNLILTADFNDITSFLSNKEIDAGETAVINVAVTNKGQGTAFKVKIDTDAEYSGIQFDSNIDLGDIQPGESKHAKLNVVAGLNIISGITKFSVTCAEIRNYHCIPKTLKLNVNNLKKPELQFTNYSRAYINDGGGKARGNGNKIIENGETIELRPILHNIGDGDALSVKVKIDSINTGIQIKQGKSIIPKISAGGSSEASLVFTLPENFYREDIKLNLHAVDARKAFNVKASYIIETRSNRSALVIGNNNYHPKFSDLTNPINDAMDIKKMLENYRFDVMLLTNADKFIMNKKLMNLLKISLEMARHCFTFQDMAFK